LIKLTRWLTRIQDDGTFSKINGTVTLCVESFSQSDIESLMAVLKNKFGLECRIEKRSKIHFRIVIKKSSLVQLREIVSPHFHNSLPQRGRSDFN
jgi:hypothetical protein